MRGLSVAPLGRGYSSGSLSPLVEGAGNVMDLLPAQGLEGGPAGGGQTYKKGMGVGHLQKLPKGDR